MKLELMTKVPYEVLFTVLSEYPLDKKPSISLYQLHPKVTQIKAETAVELFTFGKKVGQKLK